MCAERRSAAGFSLIELVLFIVIVGGALAGTLAVLNSTVLKSADAMQLKQSLAIGEAFLDEILSREYSNPTVYTTSPPVNPRNAYADVDDYNLYSITGVTSYTGTAIPGLGAYHVAVAVAAPAAVSGSTMKQITVTVTDPSANAYTFTAYKAGY